MRGRGRDTGRTTIRDVARLADVSVASASRALNGLDNVTEATREKVLNAAKQLRFVPHIGARALSTRRTETVGLVLPDLHGEFFSELMRGIDSAARTRGLHLLVSSTHGDAHEAALGIRSMRGRVDGLLVMSPYVDAIVIADNADRDFPIVLMNTEGAGTRLPSLRVDNYGGALAVTAHLREIGRKRIAHISGPAANHEAQERLRGYVAAVGGGAEARVVKGDFSEQSGMAATRALFSEREPPDAIFAANDTMAVGALLALRELNVRVPDDLALAGFDDIPIARLMEPALTTVQISIADWGRRALERLALWVESGEHDNTAETVQPRLVVRRSTAGAAATP